MVNNKSIFDNNQLVVSYELLQLVQWLVDHEPEALKELISQALNDGLHEQIIESHNEDTYIPETTELQQSIIDFFTLLETCMQDTSDAANEEIRQLQKNMIPAIDQIDSMACGETTLATSIARATSQLKSNKRQSAKELLCKELLKNWNPSKKRLIN